MINQNQIKDKYFATIIEAKAAGRPNEVCYVEDTGLNYKYIVSGSAYTPDDVNVLITGNGGDTRWVSINKFNELKLNTNPTTSTFEDGKIYWDKLNKTVAIETNSDVTLQIGQEDLRLVYNDTGATLYNGNPVYSTGIFVGTGGMSGNDVPKVDYAKADLETTADVIGILTQDIAYQSYGFINVRGNINGLNTLAIGGSYISHKGMMIVSKVGGTHSNTNTFQIVDSGGAGPIHYYETDEHTFILDLVGLTGTTATEAVAEIYAHYATANMMAAVVNGSTVLSVDAAPVSLEGGVDISVNDILYLSPIVAGGLTTVIPEAPNLQVRLGRLLTISATVGRINTRIERMTKLTDLADVATSSPVVDDVLVFDGLDWVNGKGVVVSGSMGVEFFADDALILDKTPGLASNSHKIETLSKIPTATSQQVESFTTSSALILGEAYLYDTALGRNSLDAGIWTFDIYCSANSTNSSPQIDKNIYRVILGTDTLVTSRSSTTLSVTAGSGSPFAAGDGTADLSTCGYLQTPKGLFEITVGAVGGDAKKATCTCLAAYGADESLSAGEWKVWKKLFGINTGNIPYTGTSYGLISKQSVQLAHSLTADLSDRLGEIVFARSTNTGRIIYYVHNGTNFASHFQSPLITLHNNLAGLNQGAYRHIPASVAANDFAVGEAGTGNWEKKTLAESRTILGLDGATNTIAVGGGANTAPVWTAATGSGSPVRATDNTQTIQKQLWTASTELTISSGVITATQTLHTVDTESDADSDDLVTITAGGAEQLLCIRANHTDRTIVIKESGNISCGGSDIILDSTNKFVLFIYDTTLSKWIVVGGAGGGGVYTNTYLSSATWTVDHLLNAVGIVVQCWDNSGSPVKIEPLSITYTTVNQCVISWGTVSVAGRVSVVKAG